MWGLQAYVMKVGYNSMKAECIFMYMTIGALVFSPFAIFKASHDLGGIALRDFVYDRGTAHRVELEYQEVQLLERLVFISGLGHRRQQVLRLLDVFFQLHFRLSRERKATTRPSVVRERK